MCEKASTSQWSWGRYQSLLEIIPSWAKSHRVHVGCVCGTLTCIDVKRLFLLPLLFTRTCFQHTWALLETHTTHTFIYNTTLLVFSESAVRTCCRFSIVYPLEPNFNTPNTNRDSLSPPPAADPSAAQSSSRPSSSLPDNRPRRKRARLDYTHSPCSSSSMQITNASPSATQQHNGNSSNDNGNGSSSSSSSNNNNNKTISQQGNGSIHNNNNNNSQPEMLGRVNKQELVRLILQSLNDLGYQ